MEQPLPFINFYGKKVNASVEDKKANRLILDEAGVWTTNNIENKNKFKTMTDYAIHSPNFQTVLNEVLENFGIEYKD